MSRRVADKSQHIHTGIVLKFRDGRLYFGFSPKYNLHPCGDGLIVRYHSVEYLSLWRCSHGSVPNAIRPFAACTAACRFAIAHSVFFRGEQQMLTVLAFCDECGFHFCSTTVRAIAADVEYGCFYPCAGSHTYHKRQKKAGSCEQEHFFHLLSSLTIYVSNMVEFVELKIFFFLRRSNRRRNAPSKTKKAAILISCLKSKWQPFSDYRRGDK